eukprot:COSAG05_NODE_23947_length_254_cov_2.000000_1_plen_41_part_01
MARISPAMHQLSTASTAAGQLHQLPTRTCTDFPQDLYSGKQ